MNDPVMVAARADLKPTDTAELDGALGNESCVFPITVLGRLRGVLVCARRPGERFTADEKSLLSDVLHDVGAAWRILRARDNEQLVRARYRSHLGGGLMTAARAFCDAHLDSKAKWRFRTESLATSAWLWQNTSAIRETRAIR